MRKVLLAAMLTLVAPAVRAEPVLALHADTGTLEEAFALDGAGGRLAYVRSDAAGAHELEVVAIDQKGATLARVPLGDAAPASVTLSPSGIFVVTRGADGAVADAALYEATGKLARRFPPATDVVLVEQTVASYVARGTTIEVTRQELRGPAVKRTLTVDASGEIAALELRPHYWRGGYAQLVGRHRGRFDKAKDRLLNDTEGVYDVARGAIVRDVVIGDVLGWTKLQKERMQRWNVNSFVFASEDGARLTVVTADDKLVPLELPMGSYDAASLAQQAMPDGRIVFSLTVDPLNPEAMARQKRDPERIDFFRYDPSSPAPTKLLELDRGGRDFIWRASATRVAVLRKHKAYGRGGPDLEVHDFKP